MKLAAAGFLVASAVLHGGQAVAAFHPIEGQPYRYVTRQERTDGAVQRSFTAERRVVFRRLGAGWRAEVTLVRTGQTAGAAIGGMFQAAMAALIDRPILFDLDETGHIIGIDDLDAVWNAAMDGIDAAGGGKGSGPQGAARRSDTRAVTAPMRALPPERRRAILASMLSPLIDLEAPKRQPGSRPVTIPSVSPVGAPMELTGEESATIDPRGILLVEMRATGAVAPLIAPDTPGAALAPPGATATATVHIAARRRVDSATGLVLESRDENNVCTGSGGAKSCLSTITESTLTTTVSLYPLGNPPGCLTFMASQRIGHASVPSPKGGAFRFNN